MEQAELERLIEQSKTAPKQPGVYLMKSLAPFFLEKRKVRRLRAKEKMQTNGC